MAIYLCGPLLYQILSPGRGLRSKWAAILMTVGMVFSTSGMGIVAAVPMWILYFARKSDTAGDNRLSFSRLFQPRNLLVIMAAVLVLLVMYFKVDFFRRSVNRVFSSGSDYRNAVAGRVQSGAAFIRSMKGSQLLIGISDHYSEVEFHMTGFNATMYKFGIVGTLLSYAFYIGCLRHLKGKYFWLAVLLIGLSFFTPHTHGTFYMLSLSYF